jgi:purine nucleosidase
MADLRLLASWVLCVLAFNWTAAADSPFVKRKVIIDEDTFGPGTTNLQAILLFLQTQDVEVLGITVESGDGWRDENVAHALRLLELVQRTEIPVVPGCVYPLLNSEKETAQWEKCFGQLFYKGAWQEKFPDEGASRRTPYHGAAEVPSLPEGNPAVSPLQEPAADFLVRKVREFPHEVTVWTGGPLTNVAVACRLDPGFARMAKELVVMGGSFNPPDNGTPFALEYKHNPRLEFNFRWDPEAASLVLRESWARITEVPVDPTTKTMFSKALLAQVTVQKTPLADYLARYVQAFPMWDELGAALWLNPTLVTKVERRKVDVDVSHGAGYGNTLSWEPDMAPVFGGGNVDVVIDFDLPGFERFVVETLSR